MRPSPYAPSGLRPVHTLEIATVERTPVPALGAAGVVRPLLKVAVLQCGTNRHGVLVLRLEERHLTFRRHVRELPEVLAARVGLERKHLVMMNVAENVGYSVGAGFQIPDVLKRHDAVQPFAAHLGAHRQHASNGADFLGDPPRGIYLPLAVAEPMPVRGIPAFRHLSTAVLVDLHDFYSAYGKFPRHAGEPFQRPFVAAAQRRLRAVFKPERLPRTTAVPRRGEVREIRLDPILASVPAETSAAEIAYRLAPVETARPCERMEAVFLHERNALRESRVVGMAREVVWRIPRADLLPAPYRGKDGRIAESPPPPFEVAFKTRRVFEPSAREARHGRARPEPDRHVVALRKRLPAPSLPVSPLAVDVAEIAPHERQSAASDLPCDDIVVHADFASAPAMHAFAADAT